MLREMMAAATSLNGSNVTSIKVIRYGFRRGALCKARIDHALRELVCLYRAQPILLHSVQEWLSGVVTYRQPPRGVLSPGSTDRIRNRT